MPNSCTPLRLLFFTLLLLSQASHSSQSNSGTQIDETEQLEARMDGLSLASKEYYSDSEDEEDYQYNGLPTLASIKTIFSRDTIREAILVGRGIHFSTFSREEISVARREHTGGKTIYARATYELVEQDGAYDFVEQDEKDIADKDAKLFEAAKGIRRYISGLDVTRRNMFQECYVNTYETFHKKLAGTDYEGELEYYHDVYDELEYRENPHVSTSEDFVHAGKYAAGLKFQRSFKPEYDQTGKPKHPYLGKLFVILIPQDKIAELDPFFVVWAHANKQVKISHHYANNILAEREVTFTGLIPGDYVACSINVRVPSFEGSYKKYYKKKYGVSRTIYTNRQEEFQKSGRGVREKLAETLLCNIVLPHLRGQLVAHVQETCEEQGIKIIYKDLVQDFSETLPSIKEAIDKHNED